MPPRSPTVRTQLPAWAASVAIHCVVLAVALLMLARAPTRGAAEVASRQVGIVLRRPDAQSNPYLDEAEAAAEQSQDSPVDTPVDADQALPDPATAAAAMAAFLPKPPGLGPATAEQLGAGDAGEMARAGGGRRRTAGGGEAAVSVFGVQGVGQKFVYAFDRSVSMSVEGRLVGAKRQLIESLAALESIHQFQIVFFNQRVRSPDLSGGQDRIAFANEQNKQLAERFVDGVLPDGGTDRYAALSQALRYSPDVVFFLTDADDPMTTAELLRIRRQNARIGATICTIEFGSGPSHGRDNFLKQLAQMTDGQYGYVDTTRLPRR
ncbi:MAG: hypothetical protein AAGJ46_07120 [Planctomycetota bacterium]